jgi:formate dehydrogenase major subunit
MSPADAIERGIGDGERVRVESRYGSAVLPVRFTESVGRGQLFATFQTKEIFLNAVTGPHRDHVTGAPEYKVTAVRIERIGSSPIRESNIEQ